MSSKAHTLPMGYMVYERLSEDGLSFAPIMINWTISIFPTLLAARQAAVYRMAEMRKEGFPWFSDDDIVIVTIHRDEATNEIPFRAEWTEKELLERHHQEDRTRAP